MNLVYFFTVGVMMSIILGDLARFPFGVPSAIRLTDLLIFLDLVTLAIWQVAIKRAVVWPRELTWLAFFWAAALLSILLSGQWVGLAYLFRYVLYSLTLWIGFSLVKSTMMTFQRLIEMQVMVGVVIALIGFGQLALVPDINFLTDYGYDPHQFRLVSTWLDPNFLGVYLNIILVLIGYLYLQARRGWLKVAAVVITLAMILTYSRTAYLMFLVMVVMVLFKFYRRGLVWLLIGLLGLYLVVPRFAARVNGALSVDQSASERIGSWQNGLSAFNSKPLFGVGFGNLRYYYQSHNLLKVYSANGGNSGNGVDSSLIFVLATTGVVGLVLFGLFWLVVLKSLLVKKHSFLMVVMLVGLLVGSQFINGLFYPPIMLSIFLLIGAELA